MKKSYYLAYFLGSCGYTIPFFLIALYLINFYNPPSHENLPDLFPNRTFLGISILSIVIVVSRLFDIFIDPIVAYKSDNSKNKWGKRLPFLVFACIPIFIATFLIFYPPIIGPVFENVFWVLFLYIICITCFSAYVTPFLAHIPALCNNEKERLNISLSQGLGESIGVIFAGQAPFLWTMIQNQGIRPLPARQYSFFVLLVISFLFLVIPIFILKGSEKMNDESTFSFWNGIQTVFKNKNYTYFLISYFLFIMGVELVQAGGYYYVTVLLKLDAKHLSLFLSLMVPASILAAPLSSQFSKKFGKKKVISFIYVFFSFVMLFATFLGKYYFSPFIQALILFILGGFILGGISVLVMAIISDAVFESTKTGKVPEAIFVAGRNLSYKSGITLGAGLLATLLIFGKDRGNELGIRISCFTGFCLSMIAFIIFTYKYKEPIHKSDEK